jgi:hypothetical protein
MCFRVLEIQVEMQGSGGAVLLGKILIALLVLMTLVTFVFVVLTQLIRWVNSEPETRHIRLLWFGLWTIGGGFLLVGIVMLNKSMPRLVR